VTLTTETQRAQRRMELNEITEKIFLPYLKLGGWKLGLLINFNVPVLTDGIRRRIL